MARDGGCDDPRFDDSGTLSVISLEDLIFDDSNSRKQCENQTIWLRNMRLATARDYQPVRRRKERFS